MSDIAEQLAEREARRAERQKELDAKRDAQKLKDLDVLEDLEAKFGASKIAVCEVERYVEGFPALVIVKMPTPLLFKRYTDRCSEVNEQGQIDNANVARATDELGDGCVLYPTTEELKKLEEELPGIRRAAGGRALMMTGAKAQKGKA